MARILVADDDEDLRALVAMVLGDRGHRVETVGSGEEALGLLLPSASPAVHEGSFDAAVLDLAMPGPDGLAVVRALDAAPGGRPRCTVLLTADRSTPVRDAAAAAGVPVLRKPFDVDALVARLEALMTGAGSPDEGEPDPDPGVS
ncbi:response regulator transcription factor [Nocardioides bruguierae]|uniref:response regulator transcription factor n=1 Tax=Nocardioides bruguierae TaxID=2945102 RepID=UPI002020D088|nr:response regulator [Nocardioides bruguierae]MCL8024404.1 response regulator [Nocardioides bruguierae]